MADFVYGTNSSLTLSVYNEATNVEIGYDLGIIGAGLSLSAVNQVVGGVTIDVSDTDATVALFSTNTLYYSWFGLTTETTPGISTSALSNFNSGVRSIMNSGYLNGDSPVEIAASAPKSASSIMGDNGSYCGIVYGGNPALQPNLNGIADDGHVDIFLYQYDLLTLNTGADPSTDYVAVIRIKADGSVVLNPIIDKDPVANAGADQSVAEGALVTLDGSGSSDPEDGDNLTYAWARKDSEPVSVSLSDPTAVKPTFTAPQVGADGVTLRFGLTVTDSAGNTSDEDTVRVTVNNINQAPTADAGADQSVAEGALVALDGSGSTDPEQAGDSLSYAWHQEAGTAVALSDASAITPTFAAPAVDADETLVLRLTVTDSGGLTDDDTVSVSIRFVNQAPVAVATPESQNANVGDTVTLSGAGSYDPDAGDSIVAYSWEQIGGSPAVILNPSASSAQVSFSAPLTNATLVFALTVTDTHGGNHTATAQVNVIMGTNQPPVPDAGDDQTVFERTIVTLDASGTTDPDGVEDIVSYEWEQTEGTAVALSDVNAIQPTFTAPAAEDDFHLTFKLTVRDSAGFAPTGTVAITVWSNHPPSTPSVNTPANSGEVNGRIPLLSINNASDADGHELDYTFELYGTSDLTDLIESAVVDGSGDSTTGWQTPELSENTAYYWRVQASDGIDTSDWMDLAEFFVNATEEPPGPPAPSSPVDQAVVTTLTPTLEVTNATDPDGDPLTYEFRLYDTETAEIGGDIQRSVAIIGETDGTTGWRVSDPLVEGQTYWWRAAATDDTGLTGDWSAMAGFTVNAQNNAPDPPVLLSVSDGSDVAELAPELLIQNVTDSDGDPLVYLFEIDKVNTYSSEKLAQSGGIAAGAGGTTAWRPGTLADNTRYYWRVRAYDGQAYSAWESGEMFINLANDPPSVPKVFTPADGGVVTTRRPTLVVSAAEDVDDGASEITYDYRLFSEGDLTTPVDEEYDGSTSWTPQSADLENKHRYFWQVRAYDGHDFSTWSDLFTFTIDANFYLPTTPVINQPYDGGTVASTTPVLSVISATDGDGEALSIVFELYADENLTEFVADHEAVQGTLITSWKVPTVLDDGATYYWRARATDGALESSWTNTASFRVNSDGGDTAVEFTVIKVVVADSDSETSISIDDGNLSGLRMTIPAGALSESTTVYIGEATRAPALPEGTQALGPVIEFGPSGMEFNAEYPVEVRIPYDSEKLASSGQGSAQGALHLFTYSVTEGRWKDSQEDEGVSIIIDVDPVDNVLICRLSHFSLYTVAIPDSTGSGDGSGGGGGGGCFIQSAGGGGSIALFLRLMTNFFINQL
ncbi:hypothetical protein JCM12296A_29430 [Desulfosarcina cetonica]